MSEASGNYVMVNVREANGIVLDWLAAFASDQDADYVQAPDQFELLHGESGGGCYRYSSDPALAFELMDREGISLECLWPRNPAKKTWQARIGLLPVLASRDPMVAAVRCYVASRLGETAFAPRELLALTEEEEPAARQRGPRP